MRAGTEVGPGQRGKPLSSYTDRVRCVEESRGFFTVWSFSLCWEVDVLAGQLLAAAGVSQPVNACVRVRACVPSTKRQMALKAGIQRELPAEQMPLSG